VSDGAERVHLRGLGSCFRRWAGWWIAYHRHGILHRESVAKLLGKPPAETTRADAERCLRAAVRRPPPTRRRAGTRETVTAVLDRYLSTVKGRKSFSDIRNECQHLKASLGPLLAAHVDRTVLIEYRDQAIAAGFARGTVKKRLALPPGRLLLRPGGGHDRARAILAHARGIATARGLLRSG
jgi:hypothetical protein